MDLNLKTANPPDILYHGTTIKFIERILKKGLNKHQRRYVHLIRNTATAITVETRHGKRVILHINVKLMLNERLVFYLSENNVWLSDAVPFQYISFANERQRSSTEEFI